ncbi:inactive protein RESTRICTED TEV MOVEMENT 2-like [Abeliophyllum distichum]|uniref:Inactive protein RESTRICTED TEV MOVEMENT 2-like n=1 Tax=Abeliophyllum distichum TaxID=126358 RepID=A0ABD1RBX5_9LAMI
MRDYLRTTKGTNPAKMDSRMGTGANYQMSYFQPASELTQEEDRDTLIIDLTGFRKEQLKAQLSHDSKSLTISGARQLEDNRWIGFHKDFPLPPNCETEKISARFDHGMLYVNIPKLISPAEKEDSKLPPLETRKPWKPTEEPVNTPEKNREQASQQNLASDNQNKQIDSKNVPQKSLVKEETESSNAKSQEQAHEKTLANDDEKTQIGAKNVPEKSLEKEETESSNAKSQEQARKKTLANDEDKKKQIGAKNVPEKSLEKEEPESSNAESKEQIREKTFASDDQNKQSSVKNVTQKSLEKEEAESSNAKSNEAFDTKTVIKNSAGEKHNSIDDDQNTKRSLIDKGEEFPSTGTSQNMNSWVKASADAYAQLKMARQKMNMVLVLLAFLLGLYVGNLVWYSKKAEN